MTAPRRALFPKDLSGLSQLFETVHTADGHRAIGEHLYLELTSPGAALTGLVLEHRQQLVAYVGLTDGFQPGWWTGELAVHPAWRKREVFDSLLTAAIGEVVDNRATGLRLWTFLPHLVEAALAMGFRSERELRSLIIDLPHVNQAHYPTGVSIERFRPGHDENAWLEVNNQAFAGHPENGNWTVELLVQRMSQDWFHPDDLIVARRNDRMIGFCWTKREKPAVGEIYVIAVSPQYQGQGLGRALLINGLTHLSQAKANSAVLYVDSGNERATRMYESIGFRLDHVDRSFVKSL